MDLLLEEIIIYGSVFLLCLLVVVIYIRKQTRESRIVEQKIAQAKADGLHEPVSLHPVVDQHSCIKSGACITVCPEKDILGIRNGKATVINASQCIGHGACFHACPTQAISLCIGTEKRGFELPHVDQNFETNVPGIFIAGELGGMGLIRNAVEQGKQAIENLSKQIKKNSKAEYDVLIIGAGPAGIAASLMAKKNKLKFITLEQDSLGGTVFSFPRSKIVMTSPMDLPLYGKVKLYETSKTELLNLWEDVLQKNEISVSENTKVEVIEKTPELIKIKTKTGDEYTAQSVLISIGRRGSPRKLNVNGEGLEKVAYRLLEPEDISGKNITVVGGGDSAIESALLLADQNKVSLSYRKESFNRLKPKNSERIQAAISQGKLDVIFNSNIMQIEDKSLTLSKSNSEDEMTIANDLVYIFAGGELPTQFLKNSGIHITKKFGEAILKHE
ncbi:NAD(P)-binding domain-containing protein [Labilibaculum sp. DW002]|uniref:NAD(P)-binding domain-containing protein n=1 Tax=Paralabilibaculum antarcticum TaxID=2912572 RepID=A0ABT5VRF7_9BACT|nr:NAD(P)-binding domain-containing protein [Labilibaculum sp. DW002]MDE5418015.1 NAD(P)-binding domain-containing protein [Labilibaculum sp. DW002]